MVHSKRQNEYRIFAGTDRLACLIDVSLWLLLCAQLAHMCCLGSTMHALSVHITLQITSARDTTGEQFKQGHFRRCTERHVVVCCFNVRISA